jgi:hypothetical protein
MEDFSEALIEDYDLYEKWEILDARWGPTKLWHSNSVFELRTFLQNVHTTGVKGLRFSFNDGLYLVANGMDLTHDNMVQLAKDAYIADKNDKFEWSTAGIPNHEAFSEDNVENTYFADEDGEWLDEYNDEFADEYTLAKGSAVIDQETGEVIWVHDGKHHVLIADCGTFEVSLYNFYSKQFPEFKYGDYPKYYSVKRLFEDSVTYKALQPLIKKLYMTNM